MPYLTRAPRSNGGKREPLWTFALLDGAAAAGLKGEEPATLTRRTSPRGSPLGRCSLPELRTGGWLGKTMRFSDLDFNPESRQINVLHLRLLRCKMKMNRLFLQPSGVHSAAGTGQSPTVTEGTPQEGRRLCRGAVTMHIITQSGAGPPGGTW